jgi:raffinose/stachyose/melibiose transport system substrate-binding protein
MITSASKNPDVGAKFIDFITAKETQEKFPAPFAGTATVGIKPDCATSPHDCKWVEILGSDRQTYGLSDQAYTKELADIFFEVQDGVVAGRYSPEDAAKAMQTKSEAWKAANPG